LRRIIRSTTVADRLLFLVLIAASVGGFFYSREAVSQSSGVVIEVNGKAEYTFPLDTNRIVSVSGPLGPSLVEIRDRRARIREAPCPNQLCVKQGWVSKGVIVCVPNRIVVLVGDGKDAKKNVDAVSG
jgi:hypothetical protein